MAHKSKKYNFAFISGIRVKYFIQENMERVKGLTRRKATDLESCKKILDDRLPVVMIVHDAVKEHWYTVIMELCDDVWHFIVLDSLGKKVNT